MSSATSTATPDATDTPVDGDIEGWHPSPEMPDLTDPVTFPILPSHLLEAVTPHGTCREFRPGELLFEQGRRDAPFFIIDRGHAVFFDRNREGDPREYFAEVRDGMFIGDTSVFTGEPTVAECRALEPTRAMELCPDRLRDFVRRNSMAGDLILRALMARRDWLQGHGLGQIRVIGPNSCPQTYRLRDFLDRNQIPFNWADTERDQQAAAMVEQLEVGHGDLPMLIAGGELYRNPQVRAIARCIGLLPDLRAETYDLAVIGAGPGGLAAAVYGASEGLDTVVFDAEAPGGQAGTSSKIENYLGFVTGISGGALARQAVLQARKFGATLCNPVGVSRINCEGDFKTLTLDDGRTVQARAVVLATGARYRKLQAQGCEDFEGRGVYYAATHLEATHCSERPVLVVGGGNSAGQAAVFLARHASRVSIVIRRESLAETMSRYLIDRIERDPNIEVIAGAEVRCLRGPSGLEEAELVVEGTSRTVPCAAAFAMIGAEPRTDWLDGCCGLDARGFVATGRDALEHPQFAEHWTLHGAPPDREPFHLETTRPGVFAIGDVRSGSIKRVATSVGEGSMVVAFAHQLIEEASAAR